MPAFYQRHVFFCVNQRDDNSRPCCANCNSPRMQEYAKQRIQALGLAGSGKIRINKSGCLGRCEQGPVAVVYPEGVWYTYFDESDLDEIIQSHLIGGVVVQRLLIDKYSQAHLI